MSNTPPAALTRLDVTLFVFNEADGVAAFLNRLTEQSLFQRLDFDVRVVVVANGCTDGTAEVCRRTAESLSTSMPALSFEIHEIAERGKANAWNHYVHEIAEPDVDTTVFLDADITLLNADCCELGVEALRSNDHAVVSVDIAYKDVALKERPNLAERFSIAASNSEADPTTAISGQFYCARMTTLRTIVMPAAMVGEDGFLRAMLLTESFCRDEDLTRIVHAHGAEHSFRALRRPSDIFRHQVRLTLGTIVNIVLFESLRQQRAAGVEATDHIVRRNAESPTWLLDQVETSWFAHSNRTTRRRFLMRRFDRLTEQGWRARIRLAPAYGAATLVDLATYAAAVKRVRSGTAIGYW